MNTVGRAVIAFFVLLLLTVHFSTGLLASFTEKVPRAVEGIDAIIRIGLVSWLGHTNTQALLVFLTLSLPLLVYFGSGSRDRPLQPQPVTVPPARMQRMVDRAPKTELSAENKKLLGDVLVGLAEQVARDRDMVAANERPKPFVRLVPQVPILPGTSPRSWFGGAPSLPEGTAWPVCDGKPAEFLAQIDCSGLPADLWDGVGPRAGWLSFFLGTEEGYIAAKIVHTRSRGAPVQPPRLMNFEWLNLSEIPTMDWTSLARKDVPKWPVDVVWVSSPEEDPLVRAPVSGGRDGDPRAVRYETGFALTEPGWKPFDWETTLLLLDTAVAYARSAIRREQRQLATHIKVLDQVLLDPAQLPATARGTGGGKFGFDQATDVGLGNPLASRRGFASESRSRSGGRAFLGGEGRCLDRGACGHEDAGEGWCVHPASISHAERTGKFEQLVVGLGSARTAACNLSLRL